MPVSFRPHNFWDRSLCIIIVNYFLDIGYCIILKLWILFVIKICCSNTLLNRVGLIARVVLCDLITFLERHNQLHPAYEEIFLSVCAFSSFHFFFQRRTNSARFRIIQGRFRWAVLGGGGGGSFSLEILLYVSNCAEEGKSVYTECEYNHRHLCFICLYNTKQ